MKIVSQDDAHLVASDKAYGQLVIGPILIVIGAGAVYIGVTGHTVLAGLIGAAFLLFGVITLLTRKVRTITIDKAAGQLIFSVKSLRKKADYPVPVASIAKIQLAVSYHTTTTSTTGQQPVGISFGTGGVGAGGNTQTSQDTRLLLVLADGTSMDLADGSHSMNAGGIFNSVPNQATGQKIAAFIGVPFEQVGAESLGQTIAHITDLAKGRTAAPSAVAPPLATAAPAAPAAPPAPATPPSAAPAPAPAESALPSAESAPPPRAEPAAPAAEPAPPTQEPSAQPRPEPAAEPTPEPPAQASPPAPAEAPPAEPAPTPPPVEQPPAPTPPTAPPPQQ